MSDRAHCSRCGTELPAPVDLPWEPICIACIVVATGQDMTKMAQLDTSESDRTDALRRIAVGLDLPVEIIEPDQFGELHSPTLPEFLAMAENRICPKGQPWVDDETWPAGDHGHTLCYFVGGLLALVRAQKDWMNAAMVELADIEGQYGDEYLFQKHHQRFVDELRDAEKRIDGTTF